MSPSRAVGCRIEGGLFDRAVRKKVRKHVNGSELRKAGRPPISRYARRYHLKPRSEFFLSIISHVVTLLTPEFLLLTSFFVHLQMTDNVERGMITQAISVPSN